MVSAPTAKQILIANLALIVFEINVLFAIQDHKDLVALEVQLGVLKKKTALVFAMDVEPVQMIAMNLYIPVVGLQMGLVLPFHVHLMQIAIH